MSKLLSTLAGTKEKLNQYHSPSSSLAHRPIDHFSGARRYRQRLWGQNDYGEPELYSEGAEVLSVFATSYEYNLGPLSNLSEPWFPHLENRASKACASAEELQFTLPDGLSAFLHLLWATGR